MATHPDAQEEIFADSDLYAQWRLEHPNKDDTTAMLAISDDNQLAFCRDEWYESLDSAGEIAREDAAIAMESMPTPEESRRKPH